MVETVTKGLTGFKDFILRGNVIDLAIAVALGAAFTRVINALAIDLFGSLIAALGGQPDLSGLAFPVNGQEVEYGPLLAALLNFLIVAAILYFFVVVPVNHLFDRDADSDRPEAVPADVALLEEIRDLLRAQAAAGGGRADPGALGASGHRAGEAARHL
jgi:large conductance mechanosensitive channel